MDRGAVLTLDELLQVLQDRGIPLPYEIGTFIALQACERVLRAPMHVTSASVWVTAEGEVGVDASQATDEAACVGQVIELLAHLMVRSAQGLPSMLLELIEHGAAAVDGSLSQLRDALEAALVPLNRAATSRILGRLLREARRSDGARVAPHGPEIEASQLYSELDRLLGRSGHGHDDADVPESQLDAIIYTPPAPAPAAASAEQTLRLQEDYGQIRERSRALAFGLYASATGLVATVALLWYVIR